MKDYKKYLPSKKFTAIILFIVVIIVAFSLIKITIKFFKNRYEEKHGPAKIEVTVGSLTQKDSNDNGIPDWEEYLWGLNPNKNGEKNKEIINKKKEEMTASGIIKIDNSKLSGNEVLSRQFFAALVTLQQTGELDENTMKSLADAASGSISNIEISDVYTLGDLKIIDDNTTSKSKYYDSIKKLALKYKDSYIGKEMTFISQGLQNKDAQALYAAKLVANSYRDFGRDLLKTEVPRSIAPLHLQIINGYEKVSESIEGLIQMINDPLTGMQSLITYKKYNDELYNNLENLSQILQ